MSRSIESGRGVVRPAGILVPMALSLAVLSLAACNDSDESIFFDNPNGGGDPTEINVAQAQSNIEYEHWHHYASEVPEGTTGMTVLLDGLTGDADLYIVGPDESDTCSSINATTEPDECEFTDPEAGTWQVSVYGWEDAGEESYDYTLTVTLEPSDRTATLELVDEETPAGGEAAAMSLADSEQRHNQLGEQLPVLAAISELAAAQSEGVADYGVGLNGRHLGDLHLAVSRSAGERQVSFKLAIDDQATGETLRMATLPDAPMIFHDGSSRPEQGVVELRSVEGRAELMLGQHTGTAADVQLLAEPGPVFSEQAWMMEAASLDFIRRQ